MPHIEVVYVPNKDTVWHTSHDFQPGMTVHDALLVSGIFNDYPEVRDYCVGVFSVIVPSNHMLDAGDRVEIYRSLPESPKEKRRKRAKL